MPEHRREPAIYGRCGSPAARAESDPSLMLGLVVLLVANTVLVAAVAAGIAWLLA